ncbi:hypothetical protein EKM05_14030 [Flavobacterium sp. GSP27]|uniref:Uncharacterized protein n=1 Tax=Flavobacterium bomense TaxID=2497483 RepID=A0A3S0PJ63_9FLAO|nr:MULTISPECIES: hypothetical protein [Flavobacterium]RTY80877.1 hypothetical protein EKL99_14285 [Flavobacterium sp. ZB4P23]RTY87049.1 hypothetical protein EKL32_26910 [Flavobacterium sp. GSN2]RTZ04967.1 hypothetical protein EKM05_14030 [Flavobacterium sp. GSP27]RTZ06023.1 hypothetical protein EKL98_05710 [Flavobacterium bomense]
MAKIKISNLDDLEQLVLNPKVSKKDKFRIFVQALRSFPIVFIEINGIEDGNNLLIPRMLTIIREIRDDPTASSYSGLTVTFLERDKEAPPADAIIDFID